MNKTITVQTNVHSDLETVWKCWTEPGHIVNWNAASDDWECPAAENDVVEGGRFKYTMSAKDESASFDFGGRYTRVEEEEMIEYVMDDGRKASVSFEEIDGDIQVMETFEMEDEHTEEQQRTGWQAILDNFKEYVENR